MPLPSNHFFTIKKIKQRIMKRQFLLYLISTNIAYLSISLFLIIALLVLLTKDHDLQLLLVIHDIFVKYLYVGIYEFELIILLLAIGSIWFTVAIKKEIRVYNKELSSGDLNLILNADEKRRTARMVYISITSSILVFMVTFGLSPTLSENKESIDKEISNSLLKLNDMANQSIEKNDIVSLMKVYPITNGNYVYSISLNESMENDTKYVSSNLERVVFISPQSPVMDKNLLDKVYDYKYSEGATDDNTFWTYKTSNFIETGTIVYSSMRVDIPPGKCAVLWSSAESYHPPPTMTRSGATGDSASRPFVSGKPECESGRTNIYATQTLLGDAQTLSLAVTFTDLAGNPVDPKFYNRTNFFNNLTNRDYFDPFFSNAYLILDRASVDKKSPPQFCIQGYNLGYKENVWSYRSKGSKLENTPCGTQ